MDNIGQFSGLLWILKMTARVRFPKDNAFFFSRLPDLHGDQSTSSLTTHSGTEGHWKISPECTITHINRFPYTCTESLFRVWWLLLSLLTVKLFFVDRAMYLELVLHPRVMTKTSSMETVFFRWNNVCILHI